MTIVTKRILPLAALITLTAVLSAWISAGAASPRSSSAVLPTMHFRTVPGTYHMSLNGATQAKPAGISFQETGRFVNATGKIGRYFLLGTILNGSGSVLINIEARFPHRGRVELQGVAPSSASAPDTYVITGGTGVFTGADGTAVSRKNNVTVTFRPR